MKCTLNLTELFTALLSDFEVPESVSESMLRRLSDEGVGFLTRTLPEMGQAVLDGLTNGVFACPQGWSTQGRKGALPKQLASGWLDRLFTYYGGIREEVDKLDCYSIYQVLVYFKKLVLEPSENLEVASAAAFLERNEKAPTPDYGAIQFGRDILGYLAERATMPSWVSAFCAYPADHSTGAVSDVDLRGHSNEPLEYYEFRAQDKSYGIIPSLWKYRDYLGILPGTSFDLQHKVPVDNVVGQYRTVPKKAGAVRTIVKDGLARNRCVRPGVFAFRDWFEYVTGATKQGNLFGVRFRSQEQNQKLAALASMVDNEFGTLDLKAASDSVSLVTAYGLFVGLGNEILDVLMETRTQYCEFPSDPRLHGLSGRVFKMGINAGMGAQDCFLLESMVFWIAGAYGISRRRNLTIPETLNIMDTSWAQFGDDIVCRKELIDDVTFGLSCFGLIVNQEKSFVNGRVAESCGVYAFFGEATKIAFLKASGRVSFGKYGLLMRLTRDFKGKANADPEIVRVERHARVLHEHGLTKTRDAVYDQLLCLGFGHYKGVDGRVRFQLPLVSKESGNLGRVTERSDYRVNVCILVRPDGPLACVTSNQPKVGSGYCAYHQTRILGKVKGRKGARVCLRQGLTPKLEPSAVDPRIDVPHTVRLRKRRVSLERAFG